ncbi:MAG: sigma-70 family RNA polymerase sigma factor [Bacteroidales bacterium]
MKNYRNFTDNELVTKALGKDEDAYATLVNRYQESIIKFVSHFIYTPQDAEDIAITSLYRAYIYLDRFNPKFKFSTWLFSIARNTAIDQYRKKINASSLFIGENAQGMDFIEDPVGSPEDNLIGEQLMSHIMDQIEELGDNYRDIAKLRFIQDLAYEEIAQELNLSLSTVKTRIHRARKILLENIKR